MRFVHASIGLVNFGTAHGVKPGTDAREALEGLGYRVMYVPHDVICKYNASYKVSYDGKEIFPPAADELGIPLNEIWISEKYVRYERYILHHELEEIRHRAEGHDAESAHGKAMEDAEIWEGEGLWEELQREINLASLESLCRIPGSGRKLARRIMENRPYRSMKELLGVRGICGKRFDVLRDRFFCIAERP